MKTHTARRALSFIATLALLVVTVIPAAAQRRRPRVRRTTRTTRTTTVAVPALRYYTLGTNTIMRARLDSELNSGTARVGDTFSSTTTEPVYGDGVEVIPVGSHVWGRVSSVTRAGRRTPGNISVRFTSVQLPNNARYPINGSLTTLQTDQVNSDNESTVKGRSNQKRDAVFIGGGAVGGALIGAIAGGGKGAAIGAILGGALGTGARVYEKEKEADVKSGTEFGVALNQSVRLPEYRGSNR
ncbi:MAG: hypothetical protein QOF61_1430 [Acidobacteriota bacterium]|nr:hypothetical protein [Acidobacteriota bacterium]